MTMESFTKGEVIKHFGICRYLYSIGAINLGRLLFSNP